MTVSEASNDTPKKHALLPSLIIIVCRIWFVRFSLKITEEFFPFFGILPNSVVWSDSRTFLLPYSPDHLHMGKCDCLLLFGTTTSCVLILSTQLVKRHSRATPQRLQRVNLLSSFLPHIEAQHIKTCLRILSCQIDGASLDSSLILDGIRLLLRRV